MLTKITFLGAGSAFSYDNGQNNLLIEMDEGTGTHKMLVDVGTQWHDMVYKVTGKKAMEILPEIDSIFITHIHADHVGGLEEIGFLSRFLPHIEKKKLYSPASILKELWDSTLRGGMESLDHGQLTEEEENSPIGINAYFKPSYLGDNQKIKIGQTTIEPFDTVHVTNRMSTKDSCGLWITTFSGKQVMFTSDTQFAPSQMKAKYRKADIIFHDCETCPIEFASEVHSHYEDLLTLPTEVREKMWLCHYNDGPKPDCVADGFAGWVTQGQVFDIV
jgi:ribonuclease BN (tRNA processing enzyme)